VLDRGKQQLASQAPQSTTPAGLSKMSPLLSMSSAVPVTDALPAADPASSCAPPPPDTLFPKLFPSSTPLFNASRVPLDLPSPPATSLTHPAASPQTHEPSSQQRNSWPGLSPTAVGSNGRSPLSFSLTSSATASAARLVEAAPVTVTGFETPADKNMGERTPARSRTEASTTSKPNLRKGALSMFLEGGLDHSAAPQTPPLAAGVTGAGPGASGGPAWGAAPAEARSLSSAVSMKAILAEGSGTPASRTNAKPRDATAGVSTASGVKAKSRQMTLSEFVQHGAARPAKTGGSSDAGLSSKPPPWAKKQLLSGIMAAAAEVGAEKNPSLAWGSPPAALNALPSLSEIMRTEGWHGACAWQTPHASGPGGSVARSRGDPWKRFEDDTVAAAPAKPQGGLFPAQQKGKERARRRDLKGQWQTPDEAVAVRAIHDIVQEEVELRRLDGELSHPASYDAVDVTAETYVCSGRHDSEPAMGVGRRTDGDVRRDSDRGTASQSYRSRRCTSEASEHDLPDGGGAASGAGGCGRWGRQMHGAGRGTRPRRRNAAGHEGGGGGRHAGDDVLRGGNEIGEGSISNATAKPGAHRRRRGAGSGRRTQADAAPAGVAEHDTFGRGGHRRRYKLSAGGGEPQSLADMWVRFHDVSVNVENILPGNSGAYNREVELGEAAVCRLGPAEVQLLESGDGGHKCHANQGARGRGGRRHRGRRGPGAKGAGGHEDGGGRVQHSQGEMRVGPGSADRSR
jgi:hypothetical protein